MENTRSIRDLFEEAYRETVSAGIRPGRVAGLRVNTRLKKRLGQCRRRPGPDSSFEIEIAASLLENGVPDGKVKQVLIHELLHTCPDCMNHGAQWKALAEKINRAYPQYRISRTTSFEELGIDTKELQRFAVRCLSCGSVYGRMKQSRLIQHPERYRCRCGGRLVRIVPGMTPDPAAGRSGR